MMNQEHIRNIGTDYNSRGKESPTKETMCLAPRFANLNETSLAKWLVDSALCTNRSLVSPLTRDWST